MTVNFSVRGIATVSTDFVPTGAAPGVERTILSVPLKKDGQDCPSYGIVSLAARLMIRAVPPALWPESRPKGDGNSGLAAPGHCSTSSPTDFFNPWTA